MKYAKCLFRFGLLGKSFRSYISSEDFSFELNREAENLYNILTEHQNVKSHKDRTNSVKAILNGQLEIFNYCFINNKFDWNIDPITGFQWGEDVWYRDARSNLPFGTDIKRPWEAWNFILLYQFP